jgi:DNA-directed RNA polymerase specialized sigma24 family protein
VRKSAAERKPAVTLDEGLVGGESPSFDLVALDEALDRLEQIDAEQARLVELRFFGGLTIEETAEAMNISPATVKRHWTMARAWLARSSRETGPCDARTLAADQRALSRGHRARCRAT